MAKNPLYRNEFYFFSNMYDDSLITDFYRKISRESYERSVSYQQNMLGRKRHRLNSEIFYKSTIGEFKVDAKYNTSVGLPTGSRIIKFNTLILPVYHKKKFIMTYGLQYQKVPLVDFFKRNDIFDKSITVQIGKYRILSAYLIQNTDRSITLAIPNSNTDGILSTHLDKVFEEYSSDEPVWIFTDEITQVYNTNTTTTSSVSESSINGYYDIKIPSTARINKVDSAISHEQVNSWDCLVSLNSNKIGRHLLVVTPCTLISSNEDELHFSITKEFIDMIKKNGINFSIWFINRPNKKQIFRYPYSSETSPILNLNYKYNPSGNINVEVFEIDSATMCKGRKLYDPQFTQLYFPNIFDFRELNVNNSDLLIEITEYSPSYTNQVMTNSIQPLIDSLGSDLYTEFVVNDHDKSLDGISMNLKSYHPSQYPIDNDDYVKSEYYGDFRGYVLDKIVKTIESDPYLAASYYKWMIDKNRRVTTLSGTPKTLCFGTKKTGEFSGSNRIVMDTSIASIISEDIQYFTEEHSYITYYSSSEKCPACIYINGKYIRPTCTRIFKGLNYAFFPIRVINEEMQKYPSDTELIAASPITVDIYPKAYSLSVEVPKDYLVIENTTDVIKLFEHIKSPTYSLDEIAIYNTSTGEYLGSLFDIFKIRLKVSEYRIEHPEVSEKVLISHGENPEYLLTVLGEIYNTMDNKPIILSGNEVGLDLNNFIDELIDNGIITEEEKQIFSHKKLNFEDLEFIPKDDSLIGVDITVYTKNFKQEWILKSSTGTYNADSNTSTYVIESANIDTDLSRYLIFRNGLLDNSATLRKVDNKYAGALELSLNDNQTNKNGEIVIVHMPIKYHSDRFYFQHRVFYMKSADKIQVPETEYLWPISDDESDGILIYTHSGRVRNSFAFENECNIKFTLDGYRLPPKSKSTNSLYRQYYTASRAADYRLSGESPDGTVLYIDMDQPIFDIAKQNPYSENFDKNYVKNPLDVLTYISN